jgi:hypothetical protein
MNGVQDLTESTKGDIAHFEAHEQRIIVAGLIAHLKAGALKTVHLSQTRQSQGIRICTERRLLE